MSVYSSYSDWLTALGGTYSRASNASYYNSAGVLSTASTNALRFDYDPVTHAPKGILLEGARTNLCYPSEAFSTDWMPVDLLAFGAGSTVNAIAAPDGNTTADLLTEDSANSRHFIYRLLSVSASTVYTFSVFLKKKDRRYVSVGLKTNTSVYYAALFDLDSAGAYVTSTSGGTPASTAYSTTSVGNGWYRLSVTLNTGAAASSMYCSIGANDDSTPAWVEECPSYTGDGASGTYVWGAQLEAGAFASSYIPTTSGTATRAADSLTFPTSPWFNASAGAAYIEFDVIGVAAGERALSINDGSLSNMYQIYMNSTSSMGSAITVSTVNKFNKTETLSVSPVKNMTSWALNDAAESTAGNTVQTGSPDALPTVTVVNIASMVGTQQLYGHIRKIGYWPFRVTNSELQRLTT